MIALLLATALMAQDTNSALSPRARAMLDRFALPSTPGAVSIAVRFSTDTAWVGQQVELVTAAWFPRELRDRLRRPPTLRAPSLSGLWSVQSQSLPMLVNTRRVRGEVYDLFVVHQMLFPLGPGRIESPPATLTYAVPASASYFAPEERKSLSSRRAVLEVRRVPAAMLATLAGGPTARQLRLAWRAPPNGMRSGTPALVELVAEGEGNVTLWPTPAIDWQKGLRVYPERTEERTTTVGGSRGGVKRFRFTVVADSEGVVTLPQVRYPTFDPEAITVRVVTANAFALPVFASAGRTGERRPLAVSGHDEIPLATKLVRSLPGRLLGGVFIVLILLSIVANRRPLRRPRSNASQVDDPERELHRLLGTPLEAASDRVVAALRSRGVPRGEAEQARNWLAARGRRRYGPAGAATAEPTAAMTSVLGRLRRALLPVGLLLMVSGTAAAQASDGPTRYRHGEYREAAQLFANRTVAEPRAAGAWRDLGSARWQEGDDVGAVAAWWRALSLAPRDPITRQAWRGASTLPVSVQRLAPTIPISRDEFVLLAAIALLGAVGWGRSVPRRRRRVTLLVGAVCIVMALIRWRRETTHEALVRETTVLRVSPHPAAPVLAQASAWTLVVVERSEGGWLLVASPDGGRGWLPGEAVAPLASVD